MSGASGREGNVETVANELRYLEYLDEAWTVRGHGRRLDAVRRSAHDLRAHLEGGPHVVSVRTLPLAQLPYPTKYAFQGAAWTLAPFVVMTHRALLVQFMQRGMLKSLLFNPTDTERARNAPFFAKLRQRVPQALEDLLSPPFPTLESQLRQLGLSLDAIDYLAYDHFHTQDLRRVLGTRDGAETARFPNAKLIASRCEWDDWARLHPMQRAWYVADGREGVDESRVVLTDGDLAIGDGVVLARTPGHTSGNQTLFFATPKGVWGCAENGTCADAYAPLDSKIPGLRRHARTYDTDLCMNLNTPEYGADQYTSMSMERIVVDRVPRAPAFVQMFSSSEVTPSPIAPGIRPTVIFEKVESGEVVVPARDSARAAE